MEKEEKDIEWIVGEIEKVGIAISNDLIINTVYTTGIVSIMVDHWRYTAYGNVGLEHNYHQEP